MAISERPFSNQEIPSTTVGGFGVEDKAVSSAGDKLGFKPYVDAVFSFLHNPSTMPPFTMSIEGEWGSGKSSFMLQLQEALQAKGELTISFNAWRHDKMESMWSAFAIDFVEKLSNVNPWYMRWWTHLRLYFKGFDFVKGLPSLLLKLVLSVFFVYMIFILCRPQNLLMLLDNFMKKPEAVDMSKILSTFGSLALITFAIFVVKKVADVVGNPLAIDLKKFNSSPDYSSRSAFIEAFHQDLDKTIDILVGKEKKVFVFVDDLDRAEVPKAAELMQGLNMMISNSTRLIFIIGMDREKVAAGIAAKYKDMLIFLNPEQAPLNTYQGVHQALNFGYNFLEKFIQLSFRVPSPSPESLKGFLAALNASKESVQQQQAEPQKVFPNFRVSIGEDSPEFKETVTLIAPYLDNNPRRLKQFINAFRLKAHVAFNTGLFQEKENSEFSTLTLPQLGKFVALLLRWPQIVDDLVDDPQLINQLVNYDPFDPIDPEQEQEPLGSSFSAAFKKWISESRLISFLKLAPDDDDYSAYDLSETDIKSLLETSPGISFSADGSRAPAGEFNRYEENNINSQADYSQEESASTETSFDGPDIAQSYRPNAPNRKAAKKMK